MRHLVCVCLCKGRAGRGVRDIVTTGGMSRQPVERIDERSTSAMSVSATEKDPANYSRPSQGLLHVLEPGFQERVQMLPPRGILRVAGELEKRPRQARHLDGIERRE